MKKKYYTARQIRQKKQERIFFGVIIGLVIVVAVLAIVQIVTGGNDNGYVVTEEGHIHTADGQHVSTLEEMLAQDGSGLTVTEDGHIHTADGQHLGTVNVGGTSDENAETPAE